MRIAAPQMGSLELALRDLFARLGAEYVAPPKTTARTLELGVRYSPEFACLPLKITLGNFIEALDSGVDTLLMAGGCGPCRFGYYAQVQQEVLDEIRPGYRMVVLEPPKRGLLRFIKTFKSLAPHLTVRQIWRHVKTSFRKAQAYDRAERRLLEVRPRELVRGEARRVYDEAISLVSNAWNLEEIERAEAEALALFDGVAQDRDRDLLKVGIVGEFYMLLEPVVNFDIEKWLGERGCYVERSVFATDWIGPSKDNPVAEFSHEQMQKCAEPYLSHSVGGEGQPTVGHTAHFAERGFDGVVHLMPFTCMPETIAKSILPKVAQDLDLPVISFVVDEQTGKAGVMTRLEALLDLMWSRKERREERRGCLGEPELDRSVV